MDATLKSGGYAPAASAKPEGVAALGKYTVSFGLSLALTSLFNAALVVVKEVNEHTVLEWMKSATGHHWITQGVLDLALFVVLGFALAGLTERLRDRPGALLGIIAVGMLLGALLIAGFYLVA